MVTQQRGMGVAGASPERCEMAAAGSGGGGGSGVCGSGGSGNLATGAAHGQDERTAAAGVDSESGDGDTSGDGSIATGGTRPVCDERARRHIAMASVAGGQLAVKSRPAWVSATVTRPD